jgi:DNA-binding CsgD family transcriptional regulator
VDGDTLAEGCRRAREAYARRDWPAAHRAWRDALEGGGLPPDELAALADTAWWLGRVDEALAVGAQAYRALLDGGRARAAAMVALTVGLLHLLRGEELKGTDWVGRSNGLLAAEPEGAEHGYLRYVTDILAPLDGGRARDVRALDAIVVGARHVQAVGHAHGDPTLVALGRLGEGRALLKSGAGAEGTARLDEVMAALRSEALLPEWTGELYCQLMAAAHEAMDFERLRRLTELTTRWLERLPAAALFTGLCRLHRSQLHQVSGDWLRAEGDATRAYEDLRDLTAEGAAEACYQVGELRRLRGDLAGAEEAYRQAHRGGRDPQPGLALARLAAGRVKAAQQAVSAALLAVPGDRLARARLRAAEVEIALAAGDQAAAETACTELEETAEAYGTGGLELLALGARGRCLLADGRRGDALPVLRDACRRAQELGAPYESARLRVLLARLHQALGDEDTAALERGAATADFARLGAAADLRAVAGSQAGANLPAGLTPREAEVLVHVAQGRSNRQVAGVLVISERTVARHLANVFAKLGVSSRTAAAVFAHEHGLVPRADA